MPRLEDLDLLSTMLTRARRGSVDQLRFDTSGPRMKGSGTGPKRFTSSSSTTSAQPYSAVSLRSTQLHPLRRLPQHLPGLPAHRRPRLRLGVFGTDRRRFDAASQRHRRVGRGSPGLEPLRRLLRVCPVRSPCTTCWSGFVARASSEGRSKRSGAPRVQGIWIRRSRAGGSTGWRSRSAASPSGPSCAKGALRRRRRPCPIGSKNRALPALPKQSFREMWAKGLTEDRGTGRNS